jgi:polygalacturonase
MMRKKIFVLAAMLMTAACGWADNYAQYYNQLPTPVKQVSAPVIPDNKVVITEVGGVGDGITLNTDAISKGISKLNKLGGGHLIIPQGVWLTGPISLKDNIDLHLDKNAILLFSPDKRLFLDEEGKSERVDPAIRASNRKNISITGEGIIDGNGDYWRPVKRGKVSDTEWNRFKQTIGGQVTPKGDLFYPWNEKDTAANIASSAQKQEGLRNDLIRFTQCENVLIQGVTVQNSPRFHVHPCYCSNVIVDGITVRCPWNAQNGDAIDLSDCATALIVNSIVDAGDDGICMKSGSKKGDAPWGCQDILIQNNTVFHAHGGFVIGSESVGGMRNIVVRNNRYSGTDTGLRFKSSVGRGGKCENIYISDIVMSDIRGEAIVFECDYANKAAGREADKASAKMEKIPDFQDIHISNVVCRGAETGIKASGVEGQQCVHNIKISNSTIAYHQTAQNIDAKTAQIQLEGVKLVDLNK